MSQDQTAKSIPVKPGYRKKVFYLPQDQYDFAVQQAASAGVTLDAFFTDLIQDALVHVNDGRQTA